MDSVKTMSCELYWMGHIGYTRDLVVKKSLSVFMHKNGKVVIKLFIYLVCIPYDCFCLFNQRFACFLLEIFKALFLCGSLF